MQHGWYRRRSDSGIIYRVFLQRRGAEPTAATAAVAAASRCFRAHEMNSSLSRSERRRLRRHLKYPGFSAADAVRLFRPVRISVLLLFARERVPGGPRCRPKYRAASEIKSEMPFRDHVSSRVTISRLATPRNPGFCFHLISLRKKLSSSFRISIIMSIFSPSFSRNPRGKLTYPCRISSDSSVYNTLPLCTNSLVW